MKKLTITDIAKMAGVAPSTVSLVVSGKATERRISEELQERVMKVVKESGYQPNQLAVSFRTGKSKTIGLVVENISGNFFSSVAKVIQEEVESYGYQVIFVSTDNDPEKARALINMLNQRFIDGYILTPAINMEEDIENLASSDKPVVLLDTYFQNSNIPYVLVDNYAASKDGVEHFIKKGYKNIGFVNIDLPLLHMQDRERAYLETLEAHKMKADKNMVCRIELKFKKPEAIRKIAAYLKENPELDAILFATDYLGVMGLAAIRSLGLKIPEDIAVICFDDHELFNSYTPEITAIPQPIEKIGCIAASILMGEMGMEKEAKKKQVMVKAKMVLRAST